ncbi:MAG TPA: hypothetical protein DDZ51_10640 [Planctomycetaceae bacterium]|nr:hypothetical protein [Planctomycetaceae bacterium]
MLVIACWIVVSAATSMADDTRSPAMLAEVDRLVAELDAPQLGRRNAAERQLIEMGLPIAPFLPKDSDALAPEPRMRLNRVRKQLKPVVKTDAVPITANDIRLGDAKTLGAALEAISRDSGLEFKHPLDENKPISPFDSPLPFWHALDYVLDEAGLDIDYYGGDAGVVSLQPRQEGRPSRVDTAAYAGIYRLEPTIVTSRRVLRRSDLSGLSVEIELAWKPGVTPIGVSLPLDRLSAKLDDGQTIKAQGDYGNIDVSTGREIPSSTLQFSLQLPAGSPTKLTTLAGQIRSMLPGQSHRFDFPLKTISATQNSGAVTVQLEDVRKNGELHEVRLGIEFQSAGQAMESHRGFLLDNPVFVTDAAKNRQEHLGYQLYRQTATGIGISYLFDIGDNAEGTVLTYETPTAVVENEIDFVIQDILLP